MEAEFNGEVVFVLLSSDVSCFYDREDCAYISQAAEGINCPKTAEKIHNFCFIVTFIAILPTTTN